MAVRIAMSALALGITALTALCPVAQAESIKIGVVGALTGGPAEYGLAAREGARAVAEQINASGGIDINGKRYMVEVIAYDDQQKPAQAISAYIRLVNLDGVKYILLQSSASTLALRPNAERDKVVLLSAAFSPKIIDESTKYTFRIYQNGSNFVPSLISWMKSNLKERTVVSLNPNDETGWGQSDLTTKVFKENGFNVLSAELFERDQKDFAPVLTKLIAMKPELMDFGSTPPATAGLIVRQARELGFTGRFVQTGGPGWKAVVAASGTKATEGMVTVLYADPRNDAYLNLAKTYKGKVGQDPNEILVTFYDATRVLVKAMQTSGDPDDTTKVAAAFSKALPMTSLQGDTLTLGHQQIMTVDYVGVIKDGTPVVAGKLQ
ncbi:ABC transporter substrate-binding protein [Caballeronia sp. LZ008]|uniref:ABC transporter substrate-binding protein n=1 Tax=unclassified Caballeronia TaxID=2646786 RepID=UPI0020298CA8|nr:MULTISPECIES: ABC transporter substrate-binding protein [unclassified Caballeronia]MDR5798136.1 ABC transporter substrate-binding protein [Caballeronia sp. LZ008]